jgi:hypothetical protein
LTFALAPGRGRGQVLCYKFGDWVRGASFILCVLLSRNALDR